MDFLSFISHQPTSPESTSFSNKPATQSDSEISSVGSFSDDCLVLGQEKFVSLANKAGVEGGLTAPVAKVVNSATLKAEPEFNDQRSTTHKVLTDTDRSLTQAFASFKKENMLPDNFLSDETHDGPRTYWYNISKPLIHIADQARALLSSGSAVTSPSPPLPDGNLYTTTEADSTWYTSVNQAIFQSPPELFGAALDIVMNPHESNQPSLIFGDWLSNTLGSIDKSPFQDEKDLLLRSVKLLERADVQMHCAEILKVLIPEYAEQIGSRVNICLTAYVMARWSYEDVLAPVEVKSHLWSTGTEITEGTERIQSSNAMALPVPDGVSAVDFYRALGLQCVASDIYAGGLREVESSYKAFANTAEQSVFAGQPQDPHASVLDEQMLLAAAIAQSGPLASVSDLLHKYLSSSDRTALEQAQTVGAATQSLSRLCRGSRLQTQLTALCGMAVQSGDTAWDLLRRLVRGVEPTCASTQSNGYAPIPAFIAPIVAAQPECGVLESLISGLLATQGYISTNVWRPGTGTSHVSVIPIPEAFTLLDNSDTVHQKNQQALKDLVTTSSSTRPFASRLLDTAGMSGSLISATPTWGALEHYQLLQGLPKFAEWCELMVSVAEPSTTDPTLTPGEQAYLLTETLLDTVWPAVQSLWQLGPDVVDTAAGDVFGTWGELKTLTIQTISQQLMDANVVDRIEHSTFFAGLLLQRVRPELFLKDSAHLTMDYARDPAAITLRWGARLCDAVTPRASMGCTVAEVLSLSTNLAEQEGIDLQSGEAMPSESVLSDNNQDENRFSELSGIILGEETAATARAWGYKDATKWLNIMKQAEQYTQETLISLEDKKIPDLRAMARDALASGGTAPNDQYIQPANISDFSPLQSVSTEVTVWLSGKKLFRNLDAFFAGLLGQKFIPVKNRVIQRHIEETTTYKENLEGFVKNQLEILLQDFSLGELHELNTGRWRVHQMSSRDAELYRDGVLAVLEIESKRGEENTYLVFKRNTTQDLHLKKVPLSALRKKPKPKTPLDFLPTVNIYTATRRAGQLVDKIAEAIRGAPGGTGLEPGDWYNGKNEAGLLPQDPQSTASDVVKELMTPIWDKAFTWESDHDREQILLPPWAPGIDSWTGLSLIPFYDYFSKPVAERDSDDHADLILDIALTVIPASRGAGPAIKTLSSASRAGLRTMLSAGFKNGLLSIGQRVATTSVSNNARRTVIGGLWQTLQRVGKSISSGVADQAFRQGLRKGGIQLAYVTGDVVLSLSPLPLPGPKTFARGASKLWRSVRSTTGNTVEKLDSLKQAFNRQLKSSGDVVSSKFKAPHTCPIRVRRTPTLSKCVALEETHRITETRNTRFFEIDDQRLVANRTAETTTNNVYTLYKTTSTSKRNVEFSGRFGHRNPDGSWDIAVRGRDHHWAVLTQAQRDIYIKKIKQEISSSAQQEKFYTQMQANDLKSPSWKRIHESALNETHSAPSLPRTERSSAQLPGQKRTSENIPDISPASTRVKETVPHCPGLWSESVPRSQWGEHLYYYVGDTKYAEIRGGGYKNSSPWHLPVSKANPLGPETNTQYGIYVTNLAPKSSAPLELSKKIFGKLHGDEQQLSKVTHHFALDTTELPANWTLHHVKGRGLSSDHIFLLKGPITNKNLPDLPLKGSTFKPPLKTLSEHH